MWNRTVNLQYIYSKIKKIPTLTWHSFFAKLWDFKMVKLLKDPLNFKQLLKGANYKKKA